MMMNCPYDDCTFQGTQEEVDDHVAYLTSMGDPDRSSAWRRCSTCFST